MGNYRTSSLFHYTSFSSLKKIIEEGIMPNYCKEDLSYGNKEYIIGIPMVSFCDIPLMRTHLFTKRYGEYAIGLSKEWAIRNRINPIIYIINEDIISSLKFYKSYEMSLNQELSHTGCNGKQLTVNVKDPKSVSSIVTFINHSNSQDANHNLFGYTKKYQSIGRKGTNQCNYEENEWRYIVKEDQAMGIEWQWNKDSYEQWRGNALQKPKPTAELKKRKLVFDIEDITYIVVRWDRQMPGMLKYLKNLKDIGGTGKTMSNAEIDIMYSKLISIERIRNDF